MEGFISGRPYKRNNRKTFRSKLHECRNIFSGKNCIENYILALFGTVICNRWAYIHGGGPADVFYGFQIDPLITGAEDFQAEFCSTPILGDFFEN